MTAGELERELYADLARLSADIERLRGAPFLQPRRERGAIYQHPTSDADDARREAVGGDRLALCGDSRLRVVDQIPDRRLRKGGHFARKLGDGNEVRKLRHHFVTGR